jgi:hypothetical protein
MHSTVLYEAELHLDFRQLPELRRAWNDALCDTRVTILYPIRLCGPFPACPRVKYEVADRRMQ